MCCRIWDMAQSPTSQAPRCWPTRWSCLFLKTSPTPCRPCSGTPATRRDLLTARAATQPVTQVATLTTRRRWPTCRLELAAARHLWQGRTVEAQTTAALLKNRTSCRRRVRLTWSYWSLFRTAAVITRPRAVLNLHFLSECVAMSVSLCVCMLCVDLHVRVGVKAVVYILLNYSP